MQGTDESVRNGCDEIHRLRDGSAIELSDRTTRCHTGKMLSRGQQRHEGNYVEVLTFVKFSWQQRKVLYL